MNCLGAETTAVQCGCNPDEDIYEIKIDVNVAQGYFCLFANISISICFYVKKTMFGGSPNITSMSHEGL